jgi:hypothetical protein
MLVNCKGSMARLLVVLALGLVYVQATKHRYAGTGEMRSNPERGFRSEIHGACSGEGNAGISDQAIKELATFNLTVAQVCNPDGIVVCRLTSPCRFTAICLRTPRLVPVH